MHDALFVDICRQQYRAFFAMLRELIERCPESLWDERNEEPPFWQQVYHTLLAVDFYLSESPEACARPAFANEEADQLSNEPPLVLSRGQLTGYHDAVVRKFEALALQLQSGGLEAANPFPWAGPTVAHRMIYSLRHAQHHLGWLASILRRSGVEPADWICTK